MLINNDNKSVWAHYYQQASWGQGNASAMGTSVLNFKPSHIVWRNSKNPEGKSKENKKSHGSHSLKELSRDSLSKSGDCENVREAHGCLSLLY